MYFSTLEFYRETDIRVVLKVNFGKFDEQEGEDKSTNYLRRSADFIAEIAQVKPGQSTSGLVRSIVVVCTGGGDLRTKLDEKNVSFQQYFPEATKGMPVPDLGSYKI